MSARQKKQDPDQGPPKDPDGLHPVPTTWRPVLKQIVDAFVRGDYTLSTGIEFAVPLSKAMAKLVNNNVSAYGEPLVELPEETWRTSVVQWIGPHWDAMVDLWTESGRSDLVLFVRVRYGKDSALRMRVDSVHVPWRVAEEKPGASRLAPRVEPGIRRVACSIWRLFCAGLSHTHDPVVNTNPKTGQTLGNDRQQPGRPVSAEHVRNIESGAASRSDPKGR